MSCVARSAGVSGSIATVTGGVMVNLHTDRKEGESIGTRLSNDGSGRGNGQMALF